MPVDRKVARSLRERWGLFLVEGVVLLVLGLGAILLPPIALALALFLGWILAIAGLVGLFTTLLMRGAPGFPASLVSALAAIIAGLLLIGWPVAMGWPLDVVLAIFFAIEGVASVVMALEHRRAMSGRWSSMLVSGIVDIALGAILAANFPGIPPGNAGWMVGLLVGISMVFGGVSLIAMALGARAPRP